MRLGYLCLAFLLSALNSSLAGASYEYRVLATSRTSTMEKEMNEAAEANFVFSEVMGGETAMGGKEAVVVMIKDPAAPVREKRAYRLLATSKTSTMQKEIQQLGDEGFEYKGQTVFQTGLAGREVVVIMERTGPTPQKIDYRLLATSRTSTMEKELRDAGAAGYRLLGMTVSKTAFGGSELLCILRKD